MNLRNCAVRGISPTNRQWSTRPSGSRFLIALSRRVFYRDEDIVAGLYARPTGRLSYKTLYLDSVEPAERFVAHLHQAFQRRPYANEYSLKVEVITTTQKVAATKGRTKHSASIAETLLGDAS